MLQVLEHVCSLLHNRKGGKRSPNLRPWNPVPVTVPKTCSCLFATELESQEPSHLRASGQDFLPLHILLLGGCSQPPDQRGRTGPLGGGAGPTEFMVVFFAFVFNIKMCSLSETTCYGEHVFVQLERAPSPVLLRCGFVRQRLRSPAERALCPLTAATTTEASGCRLLGREARAEQAGKGVGFIGRRESEGGFLFLFFCCFLFLSFFFYFYDFCCCFLLYREVIAVIPLIETDRT